ncbi:MAG: restriction endonuclease subunit S [Candidatus Symbiobacter sp.]|nr:restriction endonuclease subunit S [Candidatus Symbiobacter sp.]
MTPRHSNIPAIRFPEFFSAPAWETKRLGEITEIINEKISTSELKKKVFISTQDLLPNFNGISLNSIPPININVNKFTKDDVLFSNIRPYLKKVWISKCEGGASNDVIIFRAKNRIDSKYLANILMGDNFLNYVMKGAKGVKMPRGDVSMMLGFNISVPALPEQQKIAECLTSLDEVIAAQAEKLEALRHYKKGLLQSLFPAAGESIPAIRFPEFCESRTWKIITISEISDGKLSSGVFNDPTKVGNGYKLINVINMYNEGTIEDKSLSLIDLNIETFSKNRVEKYDIFFTRSSLVKEGIAHSNIYLGNAQDITFDGHLIRLRPNKKIIFPLFLHYALKTGHFRSQLIAKGKSTTMTTIGQAEIACTNFALPTLPEQQKIAECLSSVDDLIDQESQKLENLKTHKRGLMQGLFPLGEAT